MEWIRFDENKIIEPLVYFIVLEGFINFPILSYYDSKNKFFFILECFSEKEHENIKSIPIHCSHYMIIDKNLLKNNDNIPKNKFNCIVFNSKFNEIEYNGHLNIHYGKSAYYCPVKELFFLWDKLGNKEYFPCHVTHYIEVPYFPIPNCYI